jgi:energy-coupling factor transporter ATP-binding protein EcfA2
MRPRHLVLDEPTAELDPAGRRRVVDALRSLAGEGVSMMIVEQRFDVLAAVCHRVVAIDEGRIVLDGPAVAVLDDPVLERIGVRRPAGSP